MRGLKCSSARGNGLEPFDFDQLLEGSSAAQQGETEFEVSKKKGGTRNWPKRAQETGGSSPDSGEGHKKLGAQVLILAKRAQETDSEGLKCSSARGNGLEPSNLLTLRGLKCSSARGNGLEPFDFDQLLEGSSAAQQGEMDLSPPF